MYRFTTTPDGTNGIKCIINPQTKRLTKKMEVLLSLYNSASYGPEGKGVIHYYYNNNGSLDPEKTRWNQRQTGGNSDWEFHGLYSGPGSITDRNGKL